MKIRIYSLSIKLLLTLILFSISSIVSSQCILGNCKNGNGIYIDRDNKKYVGMFKNSIPNGYGIKMYNSENYRCGLWKNGKFIESRDIEFIKYEINDSLIISSLEILKKEKKETSDKKSSPFFWLLICFVFLSILFFYLNKKNAKPEDIIINERENKVFIEEDKNRIKKLVEVAELDKALDLLFELTQSNLDIQNQIILQKGRMKKNEEDKIKGLEYDEKMFAKVADSILQMADELD